MTTLASLSEAHGRLRVVEASMVGAKACAAKHWFVNISQITKNHPKIHQHSSTFINIYQHSSTFINIHQQFHQQFHQHSSTVSSSLLAKEQRSVIGWQFQAISGTTPQNLFRDTLSATAATLCSKAALRSRIDLVRCQAALSTIWSLMSGFASSPVKSSLGLLFLQIRLHAISCTAA